MWHGGLIKEASQARRGRARILKSEMDAVRPQSRERRKRTASRTFSEATVHCKAWAPGPTKTPRYLTASTTECASSGEIETSASEMICLLA
jgi:hypothetical protein